MPSIQNLQKRILPKKVLNYLLKCTILVLLLFVLWEQIVGRADVSAWDLLASRLNSQQLPWIAGAILLMPLNWAFETRKWQILVLPFESIRFEKAYRAVLAGVTLSLFTPHRLGDFGGRLLLLAPQHNFKAVIATAVSGMAQFIVVFIFGILGLLGHLPYFIGELSQRIIIASIFFALLLPIALLWCFFNGRLLVRMVKGKSFMQKWQKWTNQLQLLEHYSNQKLLLALGLAALRYLTYLVQYYFILNFFGIAPSLLAAFSGIASIFIIQTSLPLPPVFGLIARGEVAILIWSNFGASPFLAVVTSYLIFIINLSIPALVGMIIILKLNILKSLGYEK